MKKFILGAMLAFSFSSVAFADSDCHRGHDDSGNCVDEKYFTCSVRDGAGRRFKSSSNGFFEQNIVQYRAMKQCRAHSSAPKTCRPLGCAKDPR